MNIRQALAQHPLREAVARFNPYKAASAGWKIFRFLLLFGLSFVILYPLLYMLSTAFRPIEEINDPSVIWIPKTFTLENFKQVIEMMDYGKTLPTSLVLNLSVSFVQMIACMVTGYGFARFKFRFQKALFGLVLFTVLVPVQIISVPSYAYFLHFDFFGIGSLVGLFTGKALTVNLLGSFLTFFLPAALGAGLKSGLFIYIFRQFFRGMPQELEDAASIDGCGIFRTFLRIMVPNTRTIMITIFMLSLVWYWNDVSLGMSYLGGTRTVTIALSNLKSAFFTFDQAAFNNPFLQITRLQAGSLLTVTPVLLLYLIVQRWFVQGILRSGIVG